MRVSANSLAFLPTFELNVMKHFKEHSENFAVNGLSLVVWGLGRSIFTAAAQVESLVWELRSHIKPTACHSQKEQEHLL